jgi:15-cis-phytoene synthase
MSQLFLNLSAHCSTLTTKMYSTSFFIASMLLERETRSSIHAIYGFVRFADEIVDTFHDQDQDALLTRFEAETYEAIGRGFSLHPILNSFQRCVNEFGIDRPLIAAFFKSMRADLSARTFVRADFEDYVYGSAEVVGLMCLKVFAAGNDQYYVKHQESARALGAAFQKVNFLRDLKDDTERLGRSYFPEVDPRNFTGEDKLLIEREIASDFDRALSGIRALPSDARSGVYMAYVYYRALFRRLQAAPPERIRSMRIRVSTPQKLLLLAQSYLRATAGLI